MTDTFATLDPAVPLTLLPVRLEARYLPRRKPTHLHVRIFPDVIHADAHRPGLSAREADAGRTFWTSIWGERDSAAVSEARRWLAAQTTPYRALWVAEVTTPTNVEAVLDPRVFEPEFPQVPTEDVAAGPVSARLLPDHWTIRLYDRDLQLVHTAVGNPIPEELAMAPSLSGAGTDAVHPITRERLPAPLAFLAGQNLLWTVDFELAEAVGMGVRIPIADVPDPVGALLAIGVRAGREALDEGTAFDELLSAHWYTRGLDAVPQGTPTNNTDAGRSGVSLSAPDIDDLFARQASTRPLAPAGRAALFAADAALLYRLPAADSTSLALGRIRANILDKVAHAEWAEGAAAWAMNLAIGYATLSGFLNGAFANAGGEVATGEHTVTLRDWFVDWVRGGAVLPVLRCGEQPYGLLPITHRPVEHRPALDFAALYEHRVTQLLATWKAALPAALDPDATDSRPSGGAEMSEAAIIAEVLGGVPHPTALHLRQATDHIPGDVERFYELMDRLQQDAEGDNMAFTNTGSEQSPLLIAWEARKHWIFGLPDDDPPLPPLNTTAQLVHLDLMRQEAENAIAEATHDTTAASRFLEALDELRPLLEFYDAATAPQSLWDWVEGAGLGDDDMVRLEGTTFAAESSSIDALVTTSGDIAEIRAALELAIARLLGFSVQPPDGPKSLLTHLIDLNVASVPPDAIGPVRVALQVLLAMVNSPQVPDPHGELERLLRETLGLSMYRIDAWVTAIAAQRLAERRRARPSGMQLGGYGWLLDLAKSDDSTSQGFIHAPSMQHAASAAVLRSGWSAYGTASGETPLSVDLSSEPVRGAHWVLDGVRNGQDLAELLGARLERYLHDAKLDEWIEKIRVAALAARGSNRAPTAIVDGLLAARGFSRAERTDQEQAFRDDIWEQTTPTSDDTTEEENRKKRVRTALRRVAGDLDAVADVTMTQGVHSLLQDNPEAASAALAITGGGDAAVPPIEVTATQRDAQLISHRVVAMWSTATEPATTPTVAPASPLAAAEPRLMAWLDGLLPPPDSVVADVRRTDPESGDVVDETMLLSQLGVTAVEAALLAGAGPDQRRSRLGRAVVAAATVFRPGEVVEVDLAAPIAVAGGGISVDEFGLLAAVLRDVLGRARPLNAADLVLPAVDASGVAADADELTDRIALVEAVLGFDSGVLADLGGDQQQRIAALLRCATIGVGKAIAAIEAGATDEAIEPVYAEVKRRVFIVEERGGDDRVELALLRLRDLVGAGFPILPRFIPIEDPDRVAAAWSSDRQRHVAAQGRTWLRQYGRVRSDLGAVAELLLLAEAASSAPPSRLGLAQLPHTPGPWAAVAKPPDDADRLSIVALTGAEALAVDAAPVAGLVFDSWTEGIPREQQQTAIAVHFDAPTARPPQAVLLSVVDDERGFSEDEVADQLLHTIELAKVRAVDPNTLEGVGQYLPTAYLPADVVVGGGGE